MVPFLAASAPSAYSGNSTLLEAADHYNIHKDAYYYWYYNYNAKLVKSYFLPQDQ